MPIPLARLLVGAVLGWAVTAFMIVWWIATPQFDQRSRITVSGQVESFAVVELSRTARELDLVIANQPVHLRVASGVFRDVLDARAPAALETGASVTALVPRDDYQQLLDGASDAGPTAYVDALAVDGYDVLTLSQSRTWDEHNRRTFTLLLPLFFLGTVFLTWLAILRRRLSQPDAARFGVAD